MELAGQAVSAEEAGKGDGLGLGQPGRTLWNTEASRGELCVEETGDHLLGWAGQRNRASGVWGLLKQTINSTIVCLV